MYGGIVWSVVPTGGLENASYMRQLTGLTLTGNQEVKRLVISAETGIGERPLLKKVQFLLL